MPPCTVEPVVARTLIARLPRLFRVPGSIPGLATYFRFSFRFFKKGSCQLLAKVCAQSTDYRLGGLSLPRKSVVRLTDRPDMTVDVYRGRKTTIQQHHGYFELVIESLTKTNPIAADIIVFGIISSIFFFFFFLF